MKSIQTKILTLILSSVLVSVLAVVLVSIINYSGTLRDNSEEIMTLQCTEKRKEINEELRNIEQSVNTIYHFAMAEMGDIEGLWQDADALSAYIEKVRALSLNVAENTEGAVSVYGRFNPEETHPQEGFFLVEELEGKFWNHEITDLSKYEKDDVERVGWYYIPINNGEPTWMLPYYNKNIGMEIISYVIPVFQGDIEVGVIGMDIEVSALYDRVDSVTVYDTGYAFLTDKETNIIHHKDFPDGIKKEEYTDELMLVYEKNLLANQTGEVVSYEYNNEKKVMVSQELENGMLFTVSAEEREIVAPQFKMLTYSLLLVVAILLIVIFITIQVTKMMIQPLKHLTEVAKEIANDQLDVIIECNSKDEVGVLAQSFQQTADHLRERIGYINHLAYVDVLTNLGNKAAYKEQVDIIEEEIALGNVDFTVFVVDINNLKPVNDNYGHESGDLLIKNAAMLLEKVWGSEMVYRIGGDEFVVVSQGESLQQCSEKIALLEEEIAKHNEQNERKELSLQMAVGMATYNKETDANFEDVFNKADASMYEDKAKKKQIK